MKKNNRKLEEQGQAQDIILESGGVYEGEVTSRDPGSQVYTVTLDGGRLVQSCVSAADAVSGMLGIQVRRPIPLGTRVKLVYSGTPYIVNTLPTNVPDLTGVGPRSMEGEPVLPKAYGEPTQGYPEGTTPAQDLLEGEVDMTNNLRVGIQLLTTFSRLQAGNRAVVETCLLNDMVRMVSEVFRHHSAVGDQEIYNDGRLNSVDRATSYEHETWGLEDPLEERASVENGKVDLEAVEDKARYRYVRFLGFLGDFLHTIVHDPAQMLGEEAQAASGKARVQIMADGTLLAQTVSEICLERVVRIQVPVKMKDWDDPSGNLAEQMNQLENRYLRLWQGWKEGEPHSFSDTCYQLREYARWLNTYHSFARFLQLNKDWKVNSETATPEPSWNSGEADRENANPQGPTVYDAYACIRIMRDGSIVLWSGDGSSLVMTGGSIDLHAAMDLNLNAARDIRVRAGGDLHLIARRHVNLAAIVGGIRSKSRTYWEALCEKGSLWLKSDAPVPPEEPVVHTGDDPAPVVREYAVLLESTAGRTGVSGGAGLRLNDDSAQGVSIRSINGDIHIATRGDLDIQGTSVGIRSLQDIRLTAQNFVSKLTGVFSILDRMTLKDTRLFVRSLFSQVVDSQAVLRTQTGPIPTPGISKTIQDTKWWDPVEPEYVHPDKVVDPAKSAIEWIDEGYADIDLFEGDPPTFDYPKDEYHDVDRPRETLTDQYLRLDNPDTAGYSTFSPQDTKLEGGKRTGKSQVLSNSLNRSFRHSGGQDLRTPAGTTPESLSVKPTSFSKETTNWYYKKEIV